MKTKIFTLGALLCLLINQLSNGQTGSYSQTLPNMQSVYYQTQVTFTNTPANATGGTLTCSWLGCQDPGIPNPTYYAYIYINGSYQSLISHNATSLCGFVSNTTNISAQTISDAVAAGGGSILLKVNVSDNCAAGMGCSCCNDPYINNLTLTYNYSKAGFSANNATICPVQTVSFTDTTPATVTSRTWYFQGGTPATSTVANPVVTYNTPGNYNVTLVTISAAGKDSSSRPAYITVQSPPAATITPNGATTFCSGGNVLLQANTGGSLYYQWKKGSNNIAGATGATYSATSSGSYRVIVTASNGCTASSAATAVTVNPLPTAILTANGVTTFCPGGSVVLSASTGNGYNYVWKKGSAVLSGATASTYTATATGTYKVIVTNNNGCSKTSNGVAVTVNSPVATATAQGPTTFCNGGGVTLQANTGTGLTYKWKINGTTITGATNSSYTAYTAGTYKVTVTNSCGSKTSQGIDVIVNPVPTATIAPNGATTFCSGSSVTLSANQGAGLTYKWKKNGTVIAGATNNNYDAATTGSYVAEITNSYGCTSLSNTVSVTVNTTSANVTAGGPTTFCNGDSVVLSANGGANLSYQWLKNNVSINGATNASYSAKTAGAYKVIVSNTATSCAKTSGSVSVVVNCRLAASLNNAIYSDIVTNPFLTNTILHIENDESNPVAVTIFSYNGQLIEQFETSNDKSDFILGDKWNKGVYLIKLKQGAKQKVIRVVKQ